MRSFAGFAVICLVTLVVQALAEHSWNAKSVRGVNTGLETCNLSDVGSKFEQIITEAVYSLADVIISLEGSVYETVTCADSGLKGFWSCASQVWADEIASVQENVKTYFTTAQDLISDIIQDLLTCVKL